MLYRPFFLVAVLAGVTCAAKPSSEPNASRDEKTRAYDDWRAQWPKRDLAPRPLDGANLALTVRKLERGLSPDRPFLIWAIGSSYTNMLGMGEIPIEIIRRRFPNAPNIVYRKHVGAAVPFQYLQGWARQGRASSKNRTPKPRQSAQCCRRACGLVATC